MLDHANNIQHAGPEKVVLLPRSSNKIVVCFMPIFNGKRDHSWEYCSNTPYTFQALSPLSTMP
jgi:hypothetical protein